MLKILFVILWLWFCDWQIWFWTLNYFKHRVHRRLLQGDYTEYLKVQRIHRKSLPRPLRANGHWPKGSKGGEYLCTHERIWTLVSFSDNFCKILANLSPPLSGRLGGASFFTYLSVIQIFTMVFAELVTLAY